VWTLVLPLTDPAPKIWPDVTIQTIGHFETEAEAAEVARELMVDSCLHG
jgi:hypothetical protein